MPRRRRGVKLGRVQDRMRFGCRDLTRMLFRVRRHRPHRFEGPQTKHSKTNGFVWARTQTHSKTNGFRRRRLQNLWGFPYGDATYGLEPYGHLWICQF